MAITVTQAAANRTAEHEDAQRTGARRPAGGEILRGAGLAIAAALLLCAGSARAQQPVDQDQDQNLVQAPAPGEVQNEPPLPSGETQWAGDDTSAWGQEQAPPEQAGQPPEGDAYSEGYQDGKRDALADQTHGPTMDDFHASLDQSGQWQQTAEYGAVWCPQVDAGWRPYTSGSWVYTRYGWTWASSEPWGWAAYHYGRWALLPGGIWAWLPGRVWAPAWVAWRWGGGYAGWAPLGPRGSIYWRQQGYWTVVEQRHFLHPIRSVMVPQERHAGIFANLHPVRPVYGRVGGPARGWVGGAVGRTIEPVRVETISHPGQAHAQGGGILRIYAPQTRPIPAPRATQGAPTGLGRAAERTNTPRWMPRPGWGGQPGSPPPIRGDGPGNTNHGQRQPPPQVQPVPHAQPPGNPPHDNHGVVVQPHQVAPGGAPTHFGGVAVHPSGPAPQPHAQPAPHAQPPAPHAQPAPAHPQHTDKKDK